MKQIIIAILMMLACFNVNAQNTVNRSGNTFSLSTENETKHLNSKITMFPTSFKYKDKYGDSHNVYISPEGNCYIGTIGRNSSGMKSIPSEITKQIYKEMNITMTNKVVRVIVVKDNDDIHIFRINSVFTAKTLIGPDRHPTEFFAKIISLNSNSYRHCSIEDIMKLEVLSIKTNDSIDSL